MIEQAIVLDVPSPPVPPPGPDGLRRAMQDVLSVESDFVAKFLPLQGMTRMPSGFPAFAQWHHAQLAEEGASWEDAAPAYALACLSHAAYGGALDPSVEWELELQWADLGTLSALPWPQARRRVMAAWSYLSGDDPLPAGLDEALESDDDESTPLLDLELVPAFVVLRASMASLSISDWHTRGQERWLPTDMPALSLAASPALAALDALTLHGFAEDEPRCLVRLAFAPQLMHTLEGVPADGDMMTVARFRLDVARWASQRESVLLRVPSPVCPGEYNLLANPRHPDMARIQRFDARPLLLDRRKSRH